MILAPSCPLLHAPLDLERESGLDQEIKHWLAFAHRKIAELAILAKALNEGRAGVRATLAAASDAVRGAPRRASTMRWCGRASAWRMPRSPAACRPRLLGAGCSASGLAFPPIRPRRLAPFRRDRRCRARAAHDKGMIEDAVYEELVRAETARAVHWQGSIGLDALVRGEFECNDMVQYFGERLSGFALTKFAWVQSDRSRCVRPPIVFSDVARPKLMTVDAWRYALSHACEEAAQGHAHRSGDDPKLVLCA